MQMLSVTPTAHCSMRCHPQLNVPLLIIDIASPVFWLLMFISTMTGLPSQKRTGQMRQMNNTRKSGGWHGETLRWAHCYTFLSVTNVIINLLWAISWRLTRNVAIVMFILQRDEYTHANLRLVDFPPEQWVWSTPLAKMSSTRSAGGLTNYRRSFMIAGKLKVQRLFLLTYLSGSWPTRCWQKQ